MICIQPRAPDRERTAEQIKLEIGSAEIKLEHSDADPWAEIEVTNVIMGFYLISDNTMRPGSVLTEVNGDAYLPYYFKMTDFSTGK